MGQMPSKAMAAMELQLSIAANLLRRLVAGCDFDLHLRSTPKPEILELLSWLLRCQFLRQASIARVGGHHNSSDRRCVSISLSHFFTSHRSNLHINAKASSALLRRHHSRSGPRILLTHSHIIIYGITSSVQPTMGGWTWRRGSPSSTAANNGSIDLEHLTASAAPMATTARPEESRAPNPANIHPPRMTRP